MIKLLLMTLFCHGIYIASQPGMILNKIAEFVHSHLSFIYKPLFACIYCMASIWGTIAYVLIQISFNEGFNPFEWLLLIVCCITANKIVYLLMHD